MRDFFEKYDHRLIPEPNSGCLLWIGAAISAGYGHGHRDGKHFYAHRAAYESVHGDGSADGLVIRHACDTPPCCNPDHLLAGSHSDNMRDAINRGRRVRQVKGERVNTARLSAGIVIEIRRLFVAGMRVGDIRRGLALTHVKWETVKLAATGTTWAHLEMPQ